ncbi:type VI secretion system protein TssA [Pseudomonas sp. PS1]|uniref:Type VI secretion system protein TssA n=1 Tax=Stutzerimonas marianensis TaxID=2929513 RepID=A0A9X1W8J3_9GAMM|nr:type VI secretion system protein TssA [Pseudomonas marianensis]MCJ0975659.1 type VI secretion system protein TssA [Pseudomonas marianensis]
MTFSTKLSARLSAVANTPISATSFAGDDARYTPAYEALEQEIGKAASLHITGSLDWEAVSEDAETLLAEQSKDLRVAVWLTWSQYQRESFAGLHAGLVMIGILCRDHWQDVHPRKDRTRAAALSWLVPRMEQVLAEHVPMAEQLPLFEQIAKELRNLEACLATHLGHQAPLILPLCRRLDEMVKRAGASHPQPGPVGAAIAQVKQAAAHVFTSTTPVEHEKDAHKSLRNLQDQARPLCSWWLKQNATDLKALRLARTLLWLPIESLPERNAENVTALRGLPADKLATYRERFAQGVYADLIADLETSIARAPFWLDGQRIAWECLQQLDAEQAMREVEIQLALFLLRLPGLDELRFHDGTPFADAETRAWIAARVMPHVQPEKAANEPMISAHGSTPTWEQALADVLPELRKDGLKRAVQQLKQGLNHAKGGRERFHWQLTLARLCLHAKKYDLAKTQLESLDQTLTATGLGDWEPDLALEVLRLLHHCCEVLPQNHAVRESKDEIYRRLCHLDLEVVLD